MECAPDSGHHPHPHQPTLEIPPHLQLLQQRMQAQSLAQIQEIKQSGAAGPFSCLANFEVTRRIGCGQFSVVHKAICTALPDRQRVALKKVKIFEMMDAKERADCIKEIELLKQCSHGNVIQYLGSFIEENVLHIVLELADAGDLTGILGHYRKHRRLIPERMIWKYYVQLCAAVDHMHGRRIMHRDIKPANVFITVDGVVKLGDLGLGRYMSSGTVVAHSVCGTPFYMSPERTYEDSYNFKSDVWSLGCVLYEMAALQSPFFADNLSLYTLCQKIQRCEYPHLPADLYSQELRHLSQQCIVAEPSQRPDAKHLFQVAQEMRARQSPQPATSSGGGGGGGATTAGQGRPAAVAASAQAQAAARVALSGPAMTAATVGLVPHAAVATGGQAAHAHGGHGGLVGHAGAHALPPMPTVPMHLD